MGGGGGGVKVLKWQALHGSLAKRLVIRTFAFGVVISMLVLMQLVCDVNPRGKLFSGFDDCDSDVGLFGMDSLLGRVLKPVTRISLPHSRYGFCEGSVNLTVNVVRELMSKDLLRNDVNALCIGRGSAEAEMVLHESGFGNVDVISKHPFFSLKQKQVVCELEFDDNSFGFVIARDLNKVSVPALLVNEMERVLKPGGIAAVLIDIEGSSPHDSLIRSATSVLSFLKSSDVVHVANLGSVTLVAFKKKTNKLGSFEEYHLPKNCPSIKRNKPFINAMEPLVEKNSMDNDKRIAYLPSFVDAPKGKLVYIDMGVKKASNTSGTNWFLPSYPLDSKSFRVYIVDHDALVLSSHVKSPGVTFIYHPALAESPSKERTNNAYDEEPLMGDEEFDFFIWFKETVEFADFVVLKMNTGKREMKFLTELFESGVICYVDELFLHCPESDVSGEGCINVIKSLRDVGVFAHQWSAN